MQRFTAQRKQILLMLIAVALVPVFMMVWVVFRADTDSVVFMENVSPIIIVLVAVFYVLLALLGIRWFVKQVHAIAELKNERIKAELMLLQSQVNPHFFFNMLNNLYGLVKKDANKAQALILSMSDMMRYSIHAGVKEKVSLRDEVNHLQQYIALHGIRYHKEVDIQVNLQLDVDHDVAPLLFIVLLENAFKHGVETLRNNAYVHVTISSSIDRIICSIENNFETHDNLPETPGIGLANLKRRLALIYQGKYRLSHTVDASVYRAELILLMQ